MNMMNFPRALIGKPQANADTVKMFGQIEAAVKDFRDRYDGRVNEIEASVNKLFSAQASSRLGAGPSDAFGPYDAEYSNAFNAHFRRGDVNAALSVGTDSEGGYFAPVEWDRRVHQRLAESTPMRSICMVQPTKTGAYSTIWNNNQWGSGWVGETVGRPQTSAAGLSQLVFESGEIYAMPAATQKLIDDAAINIEQWLADSVQDEFSRQEDIAFISGDGTNKPRGLLTYVTGGASDGHHPGGNLEVFNSESATEIPDTDTLLDFKYTLSAPYRQNARWLMNSLTASTIAKFKNAEGDYIWREGLQSDEPARLLGHPVTIDEAMPNIGGGNVPIAFGNFKAGYVINDRIGTRILRDPYTAKPYVLFYVTKRVGGGVMDPHAIKLMKIAVTA